MLNKRELKLLETVTQIDATSGLEQILASFVGNELRKYGFELVTDNLGSVFGVKKGTLPNGPRIMVAGHMDEVGFSVREITNLGFLKVDMRGGISPNTLLSQRVRLTLANGEKLDGSVSAVAPHLGGTSGNNLELRNMLFDFGFTSKEEAIEAGVRIGQMVIVDGPFKVLNKGKRLLAKAFDNRYGVFMALETARAFQNSSLPYDLYVGATVQEEVGLRGAKTISEVIKPDFAIVLDCSPARDMLNKDEEGHLGGGLLLRYLDRSMIAFPELLAFQEKTARKVKVATQFYYSPGGTDAGAFHLQHDGVLTLTHCICARSLHTAATVVDTSDIAGAKKVLFRMLKDLNAEKITAFKEKRR